MGEIGIIITGSTPSTSIKYYYTDDIDEGIVWVTPTDIINNITVESEKRLTSLGQKVAHIVPKNTILVTCIASIGKNTMLIDRGSFNQQINGLIPYENKYEPYFLLTESFIWSNKMKSSAPVGTMQIVNRKEFSEIDADIPDKSEQNSVGAFFRTLDHLITLHQSKFFGDILKTIASYTLYWEQRKLGEVANRFDSIRIPISENLRVLGNTPYYGANGIQDYVDGYTHDGEYVLIAEDGANDLKNYPIRLVKGRIWVNNHAHVIQGIEKFMNNQFINFAMSQVNFESIVVGCGRAKLNAEQLMDICFKIPNKNEQSNIGRLFESLDHLITLHQLEPFQMIFKAIAYRIIDYAKSKPPMWIKYEDII